MKKHLLFVSAILLGSGLATAQTWTFADEAEINDATTMFAIDSNAVNYENLSGSGQTWDYSQVNGYAANDKVVDLLDATTGAYAATFPSSTHQLIIPGFTTMFYTLDATAKQSQGFVLEIDGVGEALIDFNTDNQKLLEYPMSLGTSVNDVFEGSFTVNGNTESAQGESWVEVDGTGTLILANGVSYQDVIRIKTIDTTYASVNFGAPIPVTIARKQFEYYKSGESGFPLFSHSSFDVINSFFPLSFSVVLSSENPTNLVGIQENNVANLAVYPNPNNGEFTVRMAELDAQTTIVIYDAIGNIVERISPSSEIVSVDISNEPKGVYFVKVSTSDMNKTLKVILR